MRHPRAALATLILTVAVFSAASARAADDPREVEGRAQFAKGEYRKALDLYATLFAETNDPLFLRNIGRCYQKLRIPDKAIDAFREYLRRSPRIKTGERTEVEGFIKEMEELQRSEAAKPVSPPPAETAPSTQPPPPDLSARPPAPATTTGAPPAAVIETPGPAPESPPVYKKWWFWTAIGVVAVGAVVAGVALSSSSTSVGNCMGVPDCVRVKN